MNASTTGANKLPLTICLKKDHSVMNSSFQAEDHRTLTDYRTHLLMLQSFLKALMRLKQGTYENSS